MLKERVQAALNDVRPALQADGGDVDLVDVSEEGVVKVKLTGACGGCPMAKMTESQGKVCSLPGVVSKVKAPSGSNCIKETSTASTPVIWPLLFRTPVKDRLG